MIAGISADGGCWMQSRVLSENNDPRKLFEPVVADITLLRHASVTLCAQCHSPVTAA